MSDIITQEGSFEWAMLQLKQGKRVAREGWNGKDMYLIRNPGLVAQKVEEGDYRALAGVEVGKEFELLPNIEMCNADGNFVPWVASQTDVKAYDWFLKDIIYKELLVLDVTPGSGLTANLGQEYGYYRGFEEYASFGRYTVVENNILFSSLIKFTLYSGKDEKDYLYLSYFCQKGSYELTKNNMRIEVDKEIYNLKLLSATEPSEETRITRGYDLTGHDGLIEKLKDENNKKRFAFAWEQK